MNASDRKRALFREVNERIREISRQFGLATGSYEVFCECLHADCQLRVVVPAEVYDEIVADSGRYLIAAGHEESAGRLLIA